MTVYLNRNWICWLNIFRHNLDDRLARDVFKFFAVHSTVNRAESFGTVVYTVRILLEVQENVCEEKTIVSHDKFHTVQCAHLDNICRNQSCWAAFIIQLNLRNTADVRRLSFYYISTLYVHIEQNFVYNICNFSGVKLHIYILYIFIFQLYFTHARAAFPNTDVLYYYCVFFLWWRPRIDQNV